MKKLYRNESDKIFAGVMGGLGMYLETDPTVLRLLFVLIAILTGLIPAIVGYIIAYIIVPPRPHFIATDMRYKDDNLSPLDEDMEENKEEAKTEDKNKEPKTEPLV